MLRPVLTVVRPYLLPAAGALLLVALFFGPTNNWSWDPSFYYAQLRAPLIDQSVDFEAEIVPERARQFRTAKGYVNSQWPVGPGMLWAPFFLLAHGYMLLFAPDLPANGFAPPYVAAVAAGSALYGLLGLLVTYRLCRLVAGRDLSLVTVTLTLLATPLFYYVFRQPLMAHSASFLMIALLLYSLLAIDQERLALRHSGLVLGALIGLNMLLRWIGVTAVILPAVFFAAYLASALRSGDWPRVTELGRQALIAAAVALLVVTPQLGFWHAARGHWLSRPIVGFSSGLVPVNLLNLLFHTNRGIIYWAPFVLIGIGGVWLIPPALLRAAAVIYLAVYLCVLGLWGDWKGGGGFGPRFFIETLPIAAIGFALLVRRIWEMRYGRAVVLGGMLFLTVHQLTLVTIVEQGWVPWPDYNNGHPLGIGYQVAGLLRLARQPLELFALRPYVGDASQAAAASYLAGARSPAIYLMPLVAALLIPVGILVGGAGARLRHLPVAALGTVVYALGWFWIYARL